MAVKAISSEIAIEANPFGIPDILTFEGDHAVVQLPSTLHGRIAARFLYGDQLGAEWDNSWLEVGRKDYTGGHELACAGINSNFDTITNNDALQIQTRYRNIARAFGIREVDYRRFLLVDVYPFYWNGILLNSVALDAQIYPTIVKALATGTAFPENTNGECNIAYQTLVNGKKLTIDLMMSLPILAELTHFAWTFMPTSHADDFFREVIAKRATEVPQDDYVTWPPREHHMLQELIKRLGGSVY